MYHHPSINHSINQWINQSIYHINQSIKSVSYIIYIYIHKRLFLFWLPLEALRGSSILCNQTARHQMAGCPFSADSHEWDLKQWSIEPSCPRHRKNRSGVDLSMLPCLPCPELWASLADVNNCSYMIQIKSNWWARLFASQNRNSEVRPNPDLKTLHSLCVHDLPCRRCNSRSNV